MLLYVPVQRCLTPIAYVLRVEDKSRRFDTSRILSISKLNISKDESAIRIILDFEMVVEKN